MVTLTFSTQEAKLDDDWAFTQPPSDQDEEDGEQDAEDAFVRQADSRCFMQLSDIRRQYLALRARLRLTLVSWEQSRCLVSTMSPAALHELYLALNATGLFDVSIILMSWLLLVQHAQSYN